MEQKETIILFTGDSITDGNRYKKKEQEWDLNHQMGHSYAYIINGILGSRYPEKRFHFRNKGVSGNRIIDLYARLETDLLPIRPDILSILVGVNDGPIDKNDYFPTPKEKYERLYRQMLEEVYQELPECRLILMEPFVCKAGKLRKEYEIWRECVTGYAEVVQKLAGDFHAIFVPLQKEFDRRCQEIEPEYWSWDGVHPTENGHGLIAMEWLKAVNGILYDKK
ncbi:MAG: SGNH/GDSL hydrolase family protein [Lachnospiraceae bacterium]|nr:SGNH/GDSL hydrolase family protein [Lachnospiraceae bacterium]